MDNQIEMFPLDEFEQQTPHNDGDGIDEYAGRVPEPRNIDAISNSSEPQRLDSAELAVPDPQGSTEPDGEATGTSEQVSDRKTSPVFEATGLTGDFELSDHALAFPDTSHEDIVALAFALLFPKRGPGRPPTPEENCRNSDNFSSPTQAQGAKAKGVGRDLINMAYKVVDPNGRVAPEIRDAVHAGTVSMNDAASETVGNSSIQVQRQALSQVKEGKSSTIHGP